MRCLGIQRELQSKEGRKEGREEVVCRQLEYSGEAVALKQAFFGSSPSRPIYLDNVRCNGSESSLLNCTSNEVGMNNCDHSEDAGVRCNGMLLCVQVII